MYEEHLSTKMYFIDIKYKTKEEVLRENKVPIHLDLPKGLSFPVSYTHLTLPTTPYV